MMVFCSKSNSNCELALFLLIFSNLLCRHQVVGQAANAEPGALNSLCTVDDSVATEEELPAYAKNVHNVRGRCLPRNACHDANGVEFALGETLCAAGLFCCYVQLPCSPSQFDEDGYIASTGTCIANGGLFGFIRVRSCVLFQD